MKCSSGERGHCCWLGKYGECQYVRKSNSPDRNWECSLRATFGSWDKVYSSIQYSKNVKPKLIAIGIEEDCGDWPNIEKGQWCATCGAGNNPNEGIF